MTTISDLIVRSVTNDYTDGVPNNSNAGRKEQLLDIGTKALCDVSIRVMACAKVAC